MARVITKVCVFVKGCNDIYDAIDAANLAVKDKDLITTDAVSLARGGSFQVVLVAPEKEER